MRILFVHTRFPGQYAALARALVATGRHDVRAIAGPDRVAEGGAPVDGVAVTEFAADEDPDLGPRHPLRPAEEAARLAASVAEAADDLRRTGYVPDLIHVHAGWGAGLLLPEVFPDAPVVAYAEWWYRNRGSDADFGMPERSLANRMRTRLFNLVLAPAYAEADALIAPTNWQRVQLPPALADRTELVPDGIDTDRLAPDPAARFALPDGRSLAPGDRVVTYVARGADPHRGYEPALAAIARLQARDPAVLAVVVGDDRVHYGPGAGGAEHGPAVRARVSLDPARTLFTGRIPYDAYRRLLQVSAAHLYLTVPFVLSWSALEAMATGCALVASATPPVEEFVTHGDNGLLVPFHDPDAIADALAETLAGGPSVARRRAAARATIEARWSLPVALAAHGALIDRLAGGPGQSPVLRP